MAENQRGWGQQGQHERHDQLHDEHRGRDEDQYRYQGSENRYNTPGYGTGEFGGTSQQYGGSSSWNQGDRDRGYERGSQGGWDNDRLSNRGWSGSHQQSSFDRDRGFGGSGSNEYRGGSPYRSFGMQSGYGQGYGQGSGWGTTQGSGWGSSGYGSQGYGGERGGYGSGYSGGYGSPQQYGAGYGSSGSWGGSSGALGGSEYGSGGSFRRSSYGGGYSGDRSHGQPRWQEQQQQFGDRGFWEKTKDEVSSWFGDEEAERRREFDRRMSDMEESRRGMEDYGQGRYARTSSSFSMSSHRGKGPKAYRRSDDRIREDISDRLADDDRVDASEIEINVHDAEVTLTGSVDSRESKRRAEDIAEMVSGVQHVQNNIRVNREGASGSRTVSQGLSSATGTGNATRSGTSEMTGTTGASATGTHGTSSSGPGSSTGLTNPGKSSSGTTGKEK